MIAVRATPILLCCGLALLGCTNEHLLPPPGPPPPGIAHYVAPGGSPAGDGTRAQPWDLKTALAGAGGRVHPGDTIWLGDGTYSGTGPLVSSIAGRPGAPILVRQAPGAHAVLDAAGATDSLQRGDFFVVEGDDVWFWGFEITDSDPDRSRDSRPNLLVNDASRTKYVNLVVHDGGIGFYTYGVRSDVEVSGCIFYNNGWSVAGEGGGHGLYVKSDVGPLVLRDNILFGQFGYGIHAYSQGSDGGLNNIHVEGNVAFNNGILTDPPSGANLLVGGLVPADRIVALGNLTYYSPGVDAANVMMGWWENPQTNGSLAFVANYLVGGDPVLRFHHWDHGFVVGNTLSAATASVLRLDDSSTTGYQWLLSRVYHNPADTAWGYGDASYPFQGWRVATGLGTSDQVGPDLPSAAAVFVRPNPFDHDRATVIIYNWPDSSVVTGDASTVLAPGDGYEIRSVMDLYGPPIASGTYAGGALAFPMAGPAPPSPIGSNLTPPAIAPQFAVLLLTRRRP